LEASYSLELIHTLTSIILDTCTWIGNLNQIHYSVQVLSSFQGLKLFIKRNTRRKITYLHSFN